MTTACSTSRKISPKANSSVTSISPSSLLGLTFSPVTVSSHLYFPAGTVCSLPGRR